MTKVDGNRTVVIIAEDDPDDRLLIRDAIIQASTRQVDVHFVHDGAEMLDYLYRRGKYRGVADCPMPELVLLDLNMPKMNGMEVLAEIKNDPALKSIPVVVLTTSQSPEYVQRSYELGGSGFVTKPGSFSELVEVMKGIERYWFKTVKLP